MGNPRAHPLDATDRRIFVLERYHSVVARQAKLRKDPPPVQLTPSRDAEAHVAPDLAVPRMGKEMLPRDRAGVLDVLGVHIPDAVAEPANEVDEIRAAEWPTRDQFRDAGRGALYKALERYGDVDTWKHTVVLNARCEEDRIEASLESYLAGRPSTRWPTRVEFDRDGRRPLLGAIDQHGAGLRYWFDRLADSQLERRLTRLLSGRTTWPTTAE